MKMKKRGLLEDYEGTKFYQNLLLIKELQFITKKKLCLFKLVKLKLIFQFYMKSAVFVITNETFKIFK